MTVNRDKTDNIASLLMQFYTMVVRKVFKHNITYIQFCISFFAEIVVLEQLKLNHVERSAIHENWIWSFKKPPQKSLSLIC